MKPTIIAILSCLLLSGCATGPAKWTKAEITKEVLYEILNYAEYRQTVYGLKEGHKELGPALGDNPSEGRLNFIYGITALGHPLVTHYIWPEYRGWWQNTTLVFKGVGFINNLYYVGIEGTF